VEVYGRHASRRGILKVTSRRASWKRASSGLIRDVVPAAEVVRRFVAEYEAGLGRLGRLKQ